VAAYLTGMRVRFGSQGINLSLKAREFYLSRVSTGEIVHVCLQDKMYPHNVKAQMRRVLSEERTPADVDRFDELQWAYSSCKSITIGLSALIRQAGNHQ